MGAPIKDMTPAEDASAEALLTSLRTIDPAERRRHASVFNYWLSIRGQRQFPAIRDLDPLEISDAGPCSVLMEMIGGGDDAEIRHLGHALKGQVEVERISDAPKPSLLSCIHAKLPVVASSRQAYAFEDSFTTDAGKTRCWVTLLPLSASGTWIDFVYAFVSLDGNGQPTADVCEAEPEAASSAEEAAETFKVGLGPLGEDEWAELETEAAAESEPVVERQPEVEPESAAVAPPEIEPALEAVSELPRDPDPETAAEWEAEDEPEPELPVEAGFSSKLLAGLASVGGFYGKATQSQPVDPEPEAVAEYFEAEVPEVEFEPEHEPQAEPVEIEETELIFKPQQAAVAPAAMEASLQDKLSDVRGMAEQARQAQEQSNIALYQGLGAAYDFALDAEDQPEDYLRLVEAQGLKIQLRSPMQPVVKLAFSGLTDDDTIRQLEAVLAWALKNDLPRGSLAERIQSEGGIGRILAA